MILRKLDQAEHGKTRELWEEVFTEDTKEFLDYYYYIKTRDNQIYVVQEDNMICSMLQLNPYSVMIGNREYDSEYIIAVATRVSYRGRGYMGALLRRSLNDMYKRKIPFTFLMPAAEAIYSPYDFRFIYDQSIGKVEWNEISDRAGGIREEEGYSFSDALLWEADEMADFFQKNFSSAWQVRTVRNAAYYQTMIMEQQSEKGGVRLIRKNGSLIGFYAYAAEDNLEVREPLLIAGCEDALIFSLQELYDGLKPEMKEQIKVTGESIKIYGCPVRYEEKKKPLIMARIVCLREMLGALTTSEQTELDCSFAVIDPLIHENSRIWRLVSKTGETEVHVSETEDSSGMIPVAPLTEILFGRMAPAELFGSNDAVMTEKLVKELEKIEKLDQVFLNEVV